jgi:hypothetical protein
MQISAIDARMSPGMIRKLPMMTSQGIVSVTTGPMR